MNTTRRPRILFIGEAVTLAHVTRPHLLAESLDSEHNDIFFASASRFDNLLSNPKFQYLKIDSISSEDFLASLSSGKWLYDREVLSSYVERELRLFHEIKPDLVVGDFRLSLAISAPYAKIPYINITNAYWSPYAERKKWTVPAYDIVSLLGLPLAQFVFQHTKSFVLNSFGKGFNTLRKEFGLKPVKSFLEGFTYGNVTLYADIPTIVKSRNLPDSHIYIGPVVWSPDVELPLWWNEINSEERVIYVTMGSSGETRVLSMVLEALSVLPVKVMVATAGRKVEASLLNQTRHAQFLPGDLASRVSELVICNGGSPTSYQALIQGTPVLGIASNLDQFLAMSNVQDSGAGLLLRSDNLNQLKVLEAVESMLSGGKYCLAARRIAQEMGKLDCRKCFQKIVIQLLSRSQTSFEQFHEVKGLQTTFN